MKKMLIHAYQLNSNQIKHIYTQDGILKKDIIDFKPFLGYHSPKEDTLWTDIYNKKVKVKVFDSIVDMNTWKKSNKNTLEILGDIDVVDMFVASEYKGDIDLDKTGLKIFNFDIECVAADGGFPNVIDTKNPIVSITINDMVLGKYYIFAYVNYKPQHENETFIQCTDEIDLIKKFLDFWNKEDPQIITGWAINTFDIPYLVNRIKKICGVEEVKRLSIDRIVNAKKETTDAGVETIYYTLQGHIIWDYIELYKKYTQEKRESYSLDNISEVELGSNKIKYHDEYDNLYDLYINNPMKFLMYNKQDTQLVYDLDYKLDYLNVAMSIMHKTKCRPDKIFGTLNPWDSLIYNELLSRKILCPPNNNHTKETFIGGYVGNPKPGLYDWTMVYDIVSSYPNQIISYNLSTETVISDYSLSEELKEVKKKYTGIDICWDLEKTKDLGEILRKYNVSFTSNGYFFDVSKEGIIPSIFSKLFRLRKEYKAELKEHKKAGRDREAKIADLYQYTIKILLNSGFGMLSNNYSRYFDLRIGEAITSNGQISCKGAINTLTKKLGLNVYYMDTDSNFVELKQILIDRFKDKYDITDNKTKVDFLLKYSERCVEPALNEFYKQLSENMNMIKNTLGMEPECIADVSLFTAPKKYIMNKLWDEGTDLVDNPKYKIRGIEIIRSSTPKVCRDKLRELIDVIFKTKDNSVLIDIVESFRKEFEVLPLEDISSSRGVKFSNYTRTSKGLPIAVGASLAYNDYLKTLKLDKKYVSIADGDKIKFCYIKTPNKLKSHVIGFMNKLPVEMLGTFEIDYKTQFKKTFISPLQIITNAIKWDIEKKYSLFDDF